MSRIDELQFRKKKFRTEALSVVPCVSKITGRGTQQFILFSFILLAYLVVQFHYAGKPNCLFFLSTSCPPSVPSPVHTFLDMLTVQWWNGKKWRPLLESGALFTLRSSQTNSHGSHMLRAYLWLQHAKKNRKQHLWSVDNIFSFRCSDWVVKN